MKLKDFSKELTEQGIQISEATRYRIQLQTVEDLQQNAELLEGLSTQLKDLKDAQKRDTWIMAFMSGVIILLALLTTLKAFSII